MARRMVLVFAIAVIEATLSAQSQTPRNDLPQPYRTTRDWGELPPGVSGPPSPRSSLRPTARIYVIHRCFENSCAGRSEAPILKYDANGKLLATWGQGMFIFPHGATVDRDGNLWVTDARGENGKGHQVFKFSPDGKVLMTLGKAGVSGSGPDLFDQPTDVVVGAERRHLRHRQPPQRQEQSRREVHEGRQVHQGVGQERIGPGRDQRAAHDRDGLARAALRRRSREQPHPDLRSGRQVPRPSGGSSAGRAASPSPATTRSTSTDSESGPDTGAHELPGIKKGIRIGSAKDGTVTAFIEDMESTVGRPLRRRRHRRRCARATSTARSSVGGCSSATSASRSKSRVAPNPHLPPSV